MAAYCDIIATAPIGKGDELRIGLMPFGNRQIVGIRVWSHRGTRYYPTKNGLALRREDLHVLIDALKQAALAAEQKWPIAENWWVE